MYIKIKSVFSVVFTDLSRYSVRTEPVWLQNSHFELPATLQWFHPTVATATHTGQREEINVSGNSVSLATVNRSVSVTYTQVKH